MPCPHAAAPGGRTLWGEPGPGATPGQETLPLRGLRGSGCEARRVKARCPSAGVIVNTHMCVLSGQTGHPNWDTSEREQTLLERRCPAQGHLGWGPPQAGRDDGHACHWVCRCQGETWIDMRFSGEEKGAPRIRP